MLVRLELIATVKNSLTKYTLYFLEKHEKALLPISITSAEYESWKHAKDCYANSIPTLYDSVKRILLALNIKLTSIIIYKITEDTCYTYLSLDLIDNTLEINCGFSDALALAAIFEADFYIKDQLLKKHGIKVTGKLLKEALENDYQVF